jgi:hypothetical protein
MPAVEAALRSHPGRPAHPDAMSRCIESCFTSAGTCIACADACLSERAIEGLLACIRQTLDCSAICQATGSVVARSKVGSSRQVLEAQLSVCTAACRACAEECRRHSDTHRHCRVCSQACEDCAHACTDMLAALRAVV